MCFYLFTPVMMTYGVRRDDNDSDVSSEDDKARRTVYSPMMVRPASAQPTPTSTASAGLSPRISLQSTASPSLNQSQSSFVQRPPSSPSVSSAASLRASALKPVAGLPRSQQWQSTLLACGVPRDHALRYAKLFDDEEIDLSQLPILDQKLLTTLGLSPEHATMLLTSK